MHILGAYRACLTCRITPGEQSVSLDEDSEYSISWGRKMVDRRYEVISNFEYSNPT